MTKTQDRYKIVKASSIEALSVAVNKTESKWKIHGIPFTAALYGRCDQWCQVLVLEGYETKNT